MATICGLRSTCICVQISVCTENAKSILGKIQRRTDDSAN
jgi:hypothetical protein